MSGVVQFIRRKDDVAIDIDAGTERTATGSLFVPIAYGDWNGNIASDFLTTAGYVLVQPSQRGAVDRAATSRHLEIDGTLRRDGFFAHAAPPSQANPLAPQIQHLAAKAKHCILLFMYGGPPSMDTAPMPCCGSSTP